jgi:hypothetical protein
MNNAHEIHLYTAGIGHEPGDTYADPGDVLDLEIVDFEDGYFTLRLPRVEDTTATALEFWGCGVCWRLQAARLHFARVDSTHWRFVEAMSVPLSSAVLDEANFISRKLDQWAHNPGDDSDRMHEIVERFGVNP